MKKLNEIWENIHPLNKLLLSGLIYFLYVLITFGLAYMLLW